MSSGFAVAPVVVAADFAAAAMCSAEAVAVAAEHIAFAVEHIAVATVVALVAADHVAVAAVTAAALPKEHMDATHTAALKMVR
jgi:hypothetical protein